MLDKNAVLQAVKNDAVGYDRKSNHMLDSRDYSRLADFFPVSELSTFGFTLKEGVDPDSFTQLEWTEEVIYDYLASDLEFAFEKAIHQRGISSSLMYEVIQMWLWILEDDLAKSDHYAPYGLPLYRQVAQKYNLPNPSDD